MDWKDLGKKLVGLGLPILGTALGGPAGGTVGAMIARAIPGDDVDPTSPVSIAASIDQYGAEAVDALKANLEHDTRIKEIALEQELAYLKDRQDARSMYKETDHGFQDEIGRKVFKQTQLLIPLLVILNMALIVYAKMKSLDPAVAVALGNILAFILGRLLDERTKVIEFLFGSSKSSADKTKLMNKSKEAPF